MASSRRRKNSLTKFLQDIVDDSKELVDDLIERAEDAEENVRDGVRDLVDDKDDDKDDEPAKADLVALQQALAELTAKVDQLAKQK